VPVSKTAQYVALYRALETVERRRTPLFVDRHAVAFLSRRLRMLVRAARVPSIHTLVARYADRRAPGARSSAIARTRFIDEVVRRGVADGAEQLVILGAGFDCRAHRLDELAKVRVFEVDRAETQAAKRSHLARSRAASRADVHYVSVDFQLDDVAKKLVDSGWDPSRRTVFIWEGVTNYLTEDAVAGVLSWISSAAPGSVVVFTYIHRGLLDGTTRFDGGEQMMDNVRRLGEPWTFGLKPDEVAPFVARFGLVVEENLGADEYRRRWLGNDGPDTRGYAFYRIAVAVTRA
jgi:methyltransferase (TIGR00027 family)